MNMNIFNVPVPPSAYLFRERDLYHTPILNTDRAKFAPFSAMTRFLNRLPSNRTRRCQMAGTYKVKLAKAERAFEEHEERNYDESVLFEA